MNHASVLTAQLLASRGVEYEELGEVDRKDVERLWLDTFAQNVKRSTGSWVHNGFKWHGFSYELEAADTGPAALKKYQNQWSAPFVVFDEKVTWAYTCQSEGYPDFTPLGDDIYVAHHNMKWTMVFTHEQPDLGPYFALRSGCAG